MGRKRSSGGGGGGGGGHDGGGSMRWLLTYADMITLLTAFFIMMYSMSVLNLSKFRQVAISIRSGFGGRIESGGGSVLNPSVGDSLKISIVPELASLEPMKVVKKMRQYVQENKLQKDIRLREIRNGFVLSMATDELLFAEGSAQMSPRALRVLDELVSLVRNTSCHIRVEGHTDNTPIKTAQFPSNWELSTARATGVVRYLIDHKIHPSRLSAAGYADSRPLFPNDTEAHRLANRRVDLVILRDRDIAPQF